MYKYSISVIIPTYRPDVYLWECLDSLEKQTLDKDQFEVLLILNGCNEPFNSKICDFIKDSTLNIKFIQTDIGGVSNARNIGIENAKGEFITFIDDDDYVSASYLKELLEKSDERAIALAYPFAFNDGSYEQIGYRMTREYNRHKPSGRQRFSYKVRRYFDGPCMKLIHISFIQGHRFDCNFRNGEDSLFMFAISDKIRYVDFTSDNAVYYRRIRSNSAGTSIKSFSYLFSNTINLIWAYNKIYIKKPFKYNSNLFLFRILGAINEFIYQYKHHCK